MAKLIEDYIPVVKFNGLNTEKDTDLGGTLSVTGAVTLASSLAVAGALSAASIAAPVLTQAITAETEAITAAESGRIFVQTRSSTTVTFTLPTPAAGLNYTFVCGDAGSEILINPGTGKAIVCKTGGASDDTGVAPAAGTGIKNTAASNVVGDFIKLVALDATTWYAVAIAGTWASQ